MIRIMILLLLFVFESIFAQGFQGSVTYKTNRKVDLNMEDSKVNSEMQKHIEKMLKKQFQKEYVLSFNSSTSIYKEEESLEEPKAASGMTFVMAGSGASDILYKNIKEKRYASKRDLMGKLFLVKDSLAKMDWKLEGETKKIGNYTCYKATTTRMTQRIQSMSVRSNEDSEGNEEETADPEGEEVTITAWYTPEIPVSNGPENYWGLPGLILEVNDGVQSMLSTKIVLNAKKKSEIKEPSKGKIVSEEKFNQIMEKKMQEMRDREPRRDDGQSIRIRIGG
ncbi:GLPGLI family protein [Aquimarina sediminis]|uniref:GLPGLI family protein n=1 Tax=Aquimarina sediminis TaxID=2070536 RepID=UPI000CA04613|nr:GLPGLI family protein [Aquimarina sediminis]